MGVSPMHVAGLPPRGVSPAMTDSFMAASQHVNRRSVLHLLPGAGSFFWAGRFPTEFPSGCNMGSSATLEAPWSIS